MFFNTPARKSVIALTLTLPLALVACGKSEDTDKDAVLTSTTTATKSSAKTSEKPSEPTSEEETSEAPPQDTPAAEPAPAPAENPEPPVETIANPFAEGIPTAAPLEPVEGGQPASEEVKSQIREVVAGIYSQQTQRELIRYIPTHTCKLILDKQPPELAEIDYNAVPDVPLKSIDPEWGQYQVSGVDEAKIDGDVASALITIQTPNGAESNTMRFRNEGGTWKMCDS